MAEQFARVNREDQAQIEADYIAAFYQLSQQTVDTTKTKYLFLQSASMSLELVANHLRLQKLDLALIEPCFDNLANIFKRHDINLEPIPDHYLEDEPGLADMLKKLRSQAICLVSPNNPTGICYTRRNFEQLVEFCKEERKLLILDVSFRMYRQPGDMFDEYRILQESGIDFVIIEDTGKAWPTKELKVSLLAMSANLFPPLFDIYTDFIFHHSQFVISFLTQFIKNSIADNLQSVHEVVDINRKVLRETIQDTILAFVGKDSTNMAWLKINGKLKARELAATLAKEDLFILPGNHFYWSEDRTGDRFIRIALIRDPDVFAQAAKKLRGILEGLK